MTQSKSTSIINILIGKKFLSCFLMCIFNFSTSSFAHSSLTYFSPLRDCGSTDDEKNITKSEEYKDYKIEWKKIIVFQSANIKVFGFALGQTDGFFCLALYKKDHLLELAGVSYHDNKKTNVAYDMKSFKNGEKENSILIKSNFIPLVRGALRDDPVLQLSIAENKQNNLNEKSFTFNLIFLKNLMQKDGGPIYKNLNFIFFVKNNPQTDVDFYGMLYKSVDKNYLFSNVLLSLKKETEIKFSLDKVALYTNESFDDKNFLKAISLDDSQPQQAQQPSLEQKKTGNE